MERGFRRAVKRSVVTRSARVPSLGELLDLSREETAYIDLSIRLSDAVKQLRKEKEVTQVELYRERRQ